MISNVKHFQHEAEKLKMDFKLWIPLHSQVNDIGNEILGQVGAQSVEFDDDNACNEYVRSSLSVNVLF